MIGGTLARRAIIRAAVLNSDLMEGVNHRSVRGLEGNMIPPGQLPICGVAVRRRNHEFVRPEKVITTPADRHAEHFKHRFVKATARGQVAYNELDVID
jgi:hypothetical protein